MYLNEAACSTIMCLYSSDVFAWSRRGKRYLISVLTTIEEILYGEPGSGSLVERIERVEKDVLQYPTWCCNAADRLNTFCRALKLRVAV